MICFDIIKCDFYIHIYCPLVLYAMVPVTLMRIVSDIFKSTEIQLIGPLGTRKLLKQCLGRIFISKNV